MPALRRLTCALLIAVAAGCSKPNADDHLKKADALYKDKHVAEAIVEYKLALQADPKRGDIHTKLADVYMQQQDAANAYRETIRAADTLPNSAEAQLKAGAFLLLTKQFEDAKSRAVKALAIDPKSVDGQLLLGNALAGLKDLDGAIREYQQAIAINPDRDGAYLNIGAIQFAKGQKAEAETAFRKAIDVAPKSIQARLALANFQWANGDLAKAEQSIKDAIAIDPTNQDAAGVLGVFYMATNRAAEAEPYFLNIVKANPTPDAKLALANYYIQVKRLEDATKILKELAANEATFAMATTRLATLDAAAGDRAAALTKINDVLNKRPKDNPARLLKSRVLYLDGKKDEALQLASTIVKDDPNDPVSGDAFAVVGAIQNDFNRPEEAIKAYEEVVKRQSRPVGALLALSALHLSSGQPDKARSYAQQALTMVPGNPVARSLLVRIDLATNNSSKAKEDVADLMKEYPKSAAPLNLLAAQQMRDGKYEEARKSYTKAAQLNPIDFEAFAGLVSVDLLTKHTKEAVARVEAILKVAQPSPAVLLLGAQTYAAAGDLAKAEELLKKAIDVDATNLQAYSLLGQLYAKQNRLDDAKDQFQHIADRNPSSPAAPTMLGMLSEAQGRAAEAEKHYQKALQGNPNAAIAANNLACIYVAQNRNLDEALQLAQVAQRVLPDEPHVNDTLGWIYYKKNLGTQAIRFLESSATNGPDDPVTLYHLGMAYILNGSTDKAKVTLRKAIALKSDFDGAADARKALTQIGG